MCVASRCAALSVVALSCVVVCGFACAYLMSDAPPQTQPDKQPASTRNPGGGPDRKLACGFRTNGEGAARFRHQHSVRGCCCRVVVATHQTDTCTLRRLSGSTCVAYLLLGSSLWCANVGDSRAVLARATSAAEEDAPEAAATSATDGSPMKTGLVAVPLSHDHKPDSCVARCVHVRLHQTVWWLRPRFSPSF